MWMRNEILIFEIAITNRNSHLWNLIRGSAKQHEVLKALRLQIYHKDSV